MSILRVVNIITIIYMDKMIKDILQWESEYLRMNRKLTERERELLRGDDIKTHEGMVFGRMYADWKKQKGYEI